MNPLDSTFAVVLCLAMRGASNKFIAARTGFWQIRIHGIVPVNVSFSCSVLWFLVFHRKQGMALNLEKVLLSLTFLHVSANPHMETTSVESLLCSHSFS